MMECDVEMQWGIEIPLRDGAQLSATLYRAADAREPAPALFVMTPYAAQTFHEQGRAFAEHGFPFLCVDVRGRGNSQGVFHPKNEAQDGHDVVEWLAQQPWCDGQVAMWGGSYSGYVQWAVAKERPPHLATIVPVAAPFRGVDSPHRHNHFMPYLMRWITYVSGRTAQDKIFGDAQFWRRAFRRAYEAGIPFDRLDEFLGNPSPLFQEWVAQPTQGAYWDRYNPTAQQYAALSLPILTITGVCDGDQPGALAHYKAHIANAPSEIHNRHYLVIGPWDHAGTRTPQRRFCGVSVGVESLVDLLNLHVEWYAWTLRGGPKPGFLRDKVAYYVMVADKWRYARSLEAITERYETLYLHSTVNPTDVFASGSLQHAPSEHGLSDEYHYDPRDVSLAELESTVDPDDRTDHRMVYASRGRRLVYHSAPLDTDTEISGFFRLTAWIAIDQPDTDFGVWIYEVGLDGRATLLGNDLLRARYRQGLTRPVLIESDEPLEYVFERFMFVSWLVKKGHRLRLVFGPIDSIYWQKNYNSGGVVARASMTDARTVRVRLFHDQLHPSALHVPIARAWKASDAD